MNKKPLVWSPYNIEKYTVNMPDGTKGGIGARKIFNGRPGLWNITWLHSVQVDNLLTWPDSDAENAPGYSASISECEATADFLCGAVTLEHLAETLTPQRWVQTVLDENLHPPIRKFWDSCTYNSWWSIVTVRIKLSRYYTETKGNVTSVNF